MNFWTKQARTAPLACLLLITASASANATATSSPQPSTPVATVGGKPLPYAALQSKIGSQVELMKAQRDAQIRAISLQSARDRAAYEEQQLNALIDARVLTLEAAAKKSTPAKLLAAVPTPTVTDAQMQAFYAAQKNEINAPYDKIKTQLRSYLQQQAAAKSQQSYYDALRRKYAVKVLLPPMREAVDPAGPARGPANAPVTIVEFSDFECPFCGRFEPELQKLSKAFPTEVRLVYRNFPLTSLHPDALHAAEAGVCADRQGKFWPMHDLMFAEQNALSIPALKQKAQRIGLDVKRFDKCLDSGEALPAIKKDEEAAEKLGLSGTPSTFIDGRFLNGAVTYAELTAMVNDELQRGAKAGSRR